MKQQEQKQELTKQQKATLENNNILVDLLLKNTKITSILNLLLDYNNIKEYQEPIIENQEYTKIQDNIISILNLLNKEYIKLMNLQKEEVKNDTQKKN